MNISIWDLDYYYKKTTMPNISCMKLSSFHKQKGDKINFIEEESHLTLAYDKFYICKELDSSPFPPRKLIDDSKVELLGHGFRYYNAKTLNKTVVACRPDYLLYHFAKENQYTNANFINFYAGKELVKMHQDWHNTKKFIKKNIVADKYFWKAKDEEIIFCLDELKDEKNLMFLESIPLNKIISNKIIRKKFLSLHFNSGTKFKWKNDYSNEVEKVQDIIDFLLELKTITHSDLGFIPFKAVLLNHLENKYNYDCDFLRCLQIINIFKKNKLKCIIINSAQQINVLNTSIFRGLETWTKYYIKLSYVEFILHDICMTQGIHWSIALNNSIKWKNKDIDNLLYLLTSNLWADYKELLFTQWGYEELNSKEINYKKIKEKLNLLYKEEIQDE